MRGFIGAAFAVIACSPRESVPPGVPRSDFSDVPLVQLESLMPALALTPLAQVEGDPVSTPTALTWIGSSIYVADLMQSVIRVYDGSGHPLRKLSRPGDGPGELRRPVAIDVDSLDGQARLLILDRARRRIVMLDTLGASAGELLLTGNWTGMSRLREPAWMLVAGLGAATLDSAALASGMNVVHELDRDGKSITSYKPFEKPMRTWEGTFNNASADAAGDFVVSGAFNTNRVLVRNRSTGSERQVDVGGPWFKPIAWPNASTDIPGNSNIERMNSWSRGQQIVVRVFAAREHFITQFRDYDSEGGVRYGYVVATYQGETVAATPFGAFQLLRVRGDTLMGLSADSAAALTLERRVLKVVSTR